MPYSTYNKAYRRPYRSRRYTRPYNRRAMVNTMRRVATQQINRRAEHKYFDVSQSIGASTTGSDRDWETSRTIRSSVSFIVC